MTSVLLDYDTCMLHTKKRPNWYSIFLDFSRPVRYRVIAHARNQSKADNTGFSNLPSHYVSVHDDKKNEKKYYLYYSKVFRLSVWVRRVILWQYVRGCTRKLMTRACIKYRFPPRRHRSRRDKNQNIPQHRHIVRHSRRHQPNQPSRRGRGRAVNRACRCIDSCIWPK